LAFDHPITDKPLVIEAKEPSYWKDYWLRGI